MADRHEKRSCSCGCDCCDVSDDTLSNQTSVSTHILGSTHNSIDLYVSTPPKPKWTFVENMEEEMKNERQRTN